MPLRLAAVALLLSAPVAVAAADDVPPAPAASDAPAEPAKPKRICRTETGTGSVMPKRVCRTPAQIEAENARARETLDARNRGQ